MYIQLETMRGMTESEVRALYPNTSFPTPFVAPEGFAVVFPTPSPIVTELQVAVRDGVEVDSKGNYVEKWAVRDMFSDYTTEEGVLVTKLEQETKYLADKAKALVPQSITPRQIRLQLSAIGMRQAVEDYVASASLEIKDWWEFSLAYERNAPLLVEAATTLGMTGEQLDQFFIEANKL
jgi:hypothetical protein